MPVTIRHAGPGDEPAVVELIQELAVAADSGIIEALVVAEGRRSEGIGRELLMAGVRKLEEAGCAEISISVEADNEAAQQLYLDAGLTDASVYLEKHVER